MFEKQLQFVFLLNDSSILFIYVVFKNIYTLFQIKAKFDFDDIHSIAILFNSYDPFMFEKQLKFVFLSMIPVSFLYT